MRKSKLLALSLILIIGFLVSGCGTSSSDTGNKVIRIGYQKGDEFNIAQIRGNLAKALKKQGYKVEWKEFQAGSALLEALRAGSIDYGRTGNTPPVVAQASGTDIVYVGVGKSKNVGSGIVVKKNSSITSLADLKGKKIAFSKGSSSHYLVVKALKKAGLTLNDVQPVYLQPADARIAFEKGNVDAWAVWDPFTAAAQITGNAKMLVNGKGITTDRDFFLAKRSFAKSHTKVTKTVMSQVSEAMDWANSHHTELIAKLADALKMDKDIVAMSVNRRTYGIDKMNSTILDEQQSIADQFYQLKIIPKKINVRDALLSN
ncbi:MAG: sulfonate ABC transporter substrate-binding protein [Sporolactobacillus sp.]|uniref:sulfonate ABC transporter substrate-binding protein n=1 Tax=Sporolactobacillus sp. STSJ-5 TaxID=2965076 RepID=UPI002104EBFC|nr:sulfonate ABC transporter substrate-binding protein [Sporolactobacillus sp. STSJ-5]MCQ2011060.1 sulfonate ABC transporter substrate-binding protein [Sporolactobacillus sp. STSJ-5]